MITKTKPVCCVFSACLMLLVLSVGSAAGEQELKEADELSQKAGKLYQTGKYAEAIPLARKALELREQALGSTHPEVALSLNFLASLLQAAGDNAEARPLLERALRISERARGPMHPEVAVNLNSLAGLLRERGDFAGARPLYERALQIFEQSLGSTHFLVGTSLNNLALLYHALGDYAKAEPLFQRALVINEQALGPTHPSVALNLSNLAELYRTTGQYAKSEPLYQRSLAIREQALGPDHPDVAISLNNLALLLQNTGDYAGARPLHERALKIQEQALGPMHSSVALSLNNLAELYRTTAQYAKAEPLYQRALAINEQVLGQDHPSVAGSLNNLALMYVSIGAYAKAEPLFQRSLAIKEKALGPMHPDVALSLNNLAGLYKTIRGYAKAEPLFQRALSINEKALGPDHPDVAAVVNQLALLYDSTGAYAKAEPLFRRSLAIYEKALGLDHPSVAMSLNNLAGLYEAMGAYAKAHPLYRRSLAIFEKVLGSDHPDVATSLNNLAGLYVAMGAYAKSESLYRRSLAIKEKALGPDHPDVAVSLNNLAWLEAAQQHYPSAISFFKRGLAIKDRQIRDIFTFTTEEQKLTFMESISGTAVGFLSLIHQHLRDDPSVVRDGLERVLRRKGIVFDAQSRARGALRSRLSEAARTEWDRLSAFRGELSQVLLNKPKNMTSEQYQEKLASLQQQIEQAEQQLAKESALVAKEVQQRTATVAAISKRLPKNGVLVEFAKIEDFDFAKGKWVGSSRYLAFILPASGAVSLLDLGDATAMESQVRRALQRIKVSMESRDINVHRKTDGMSSNQEDVQPLKDLYQRVWAPLRQALGSADQVILSPDGLLNLVPFAALIDDKGRALAESYRLVHVSSGRELVVAEGAPLKPESDLLLVANPAFDGAVQKTNSPEASLRSRDFQGDFSPLPGTEREAKEIPPLVKGQGGRQLVLVGMSATERMVRTTRSPRILHLATHGFFLQDEEIALTEGTRDLKVTKSANQAPPRKHENPLVRSGLAFAGANNASGITEGDDGILTALEITGMDLYGTELVVLSACNTGVGEIKTGEGVFGLRRAFALAGAKNLLMSLWPVSDEITANQMKAFYRNLQTMPPADALRQAQLQTIKELKAEEGFASPALWAPFILQGAQALGQ